MQVLFCSVFLSFRSQKKTEDYEICSSRAALLFRRNLFLFCFFSRRTVRFCCSFVSLFLLQNYPLFKWSGFWSKKEFDFWNLKEPKMFAWSLIMDSIRFVSIWSNFHRSTLVCAGIQTIKHSEKPSNPHLNRFYFFCFFFYSVRFSISSSYWLKTKYLKKK